jgi:hypothetical protein
MVSWLARTVATLDCLNARNEGFRGLASLQWRAWVRIDAYTASI